jgi:hypothetical protein
MVILARLKPVEHFTDKLALRAREPIGINTARDCYEERVPIISRRCIRARCPPASWLAMLLTADRSMLALEALDFHPRDQDIGSTNRDPFGWFADPLPLCLALRPHTPDVNLVQSGSLGPEQRKHVSTSDLDETHTTRAASVLTGGTAIDSAICPSVAQPTMSIGITAQRIARSFSDSKGRGGSGIANVLSTHNSFADTR